MAGNEAPVKTQSVPEFIAKFAERYQVEPTKLVGILKATVLKPTKDGREPTNEEVAAFLMVAQKYDLDPFRKEIYGFVDSRGSIVPYIGLDGWVRLITRNPNYDGCTFREVYDPDTRNFVACECTMYDKGREHPTVITEYYDECSRNTQPWENMPHRMLRNRAYVQCGRLHYGIGGIFDEDEAMSIVEARLADDHAPSGIRGVTRAKEKIRLAKAAPALVVPPPGMEVLPSAKPEEVNDPLATGAESRTRAAQPTARTHGASNTQFDMLMEESARGNAMDPNDLIAEIKEMAYMFGDEHEAEYIALLQKADCADPEVAPIAALKTARFRLISEAVKLGIYRKDRPNG